MTTLVFGLFGLIIGSFLNVLILRHDKEDIGGRSHCVRCGTQLAWYDNIPLVSFVVLRGRCRHCSARISWQYPIVEALTAALFAIIGSATSSPLWQQIYFCIIAALLVAIAVHDMRTTIIPDGWVYIFSALAFGIGVVEIGLNSPHLITASLLGGPIAAFPLFALWLVSRGAWMGFGDVKLSLGIGWLLGPAYGIVAIFFAFVIGAIVSLPILLISSDKFKQFFSRFIQHHSWRTSGTGFTMKSEIPFGPFLVASTCIIWFMLLYHLDPLAFVGLDLR